MRRPRDASEMHPCSLAYHNGFVATHWTPDELYIMLPSALGKNNSIIKVTQAVESQVTERRN